MIEDCQCVSVTEVLGVYRRELKSAMLATAVEAAGCSVELTTSATGNGGARLWFKCPRCNRRMGVIFKHPYDGSVGCRICLGLVYRQQRYKGMIEAMV